MDPHLCGSSNYRFVNVSAAVWQSVVGYLSYLAVAKGFFVGEVSIGPVKFFLELSRLLQTIKIFHKNLTFRVLDCSIVTRRSCTFFFTVGSVGIRSVIGIWILLSMR